MTDPPAPNVDLLRRTMDEILAHPDLHCQITWAIQRDCGTAMCFAGWACVLEGLEVDAEDLRLDGLTSMLDGGRAIPDVATELLGLDWRSANTLFSADNSTADLKHYVDEICEHGLIRAAQTTDPWSE